MHDDSRRLVDDEQPLVLVSDSQRQLLGAQLGRSSIALLEPQLLPTLEPVALRPRLPVEQRCPLLQQPFRGGSRADLRQ
jgi:hypothetical protein